MANTLRDELRDAINEELPINISKDIKKIILIRVSTAILKFTNNQLN